jgi:hypothetical protein
MSEWTIPLDWMIGMSGAAVGAIDATVEAITMS